MRRILLCVAIMAAVGGSLRAGGQTQITRLDGSIITSADVDRTATRLMQVAEVPGMAIAIFNHGQLVYLKAYGVRDKEKSLPLTTDSIMSAASFSKVAFAYLALELADAGILDLDKPVYHYLPKPLTQYESYSDLANDARYQRITARMLLSHTSGFPNWRWFEDDHKLKIHFDPGSKYAYSGEGIGLLQLVIETITKQPLEKLLQEHVFGPFGMTRSSMVWQPRFENDYANGYDEYGRSLGPQRRTRADAAGSMLTTVGDFARFMQAVMRGQGLLRKTREQMLSAQIRIFSKRQFPTLLPATTDENNAIRLSYGLGWGLYWTPYGEAFFKEGHDEGWRNYTVCFQPAKTGIVIMTNSSNGEGIYKDLLETLLKNTFTPIAWEEFTPYNQLPPRVPLRAHQIVQVPAGVLEMYVGRYGEPHLVLNVRREGDHLSVQENEEPKQELFPESQSSFFSKVSDDVFTFQFDSQTHAIRMILHTGGKDMVFKRLE